VALCLACGAAGSVAEAQSTVAPEALAPLRAELAGVRKVVRSLRGDVNRLRQEQSGTRAQIEAQTSAVSSLVRRTEALEKWAWGFGGAAAVLTLGVLAALAGRRVPGSPAAGWAQPDPAELSEPAEAFRRRLRTMETRLSALEQDAAPFEGPHRSGG
jgi:hypothetical protein